LGLIARCVDHLYSNFSTSTMADYPSHDEFTTQAQKLMRYRIPLVLGLLINCALIARVPLSQMRAASSARDGQSRTGAVDPTVAAEAAPRTSDQFEPVQIEASESTVVGHSPAMPAPVDPMVAELGPPVRTPELEIIVPTESANNVAEVETFASSMVPSAPPTIDMSQLDLSWAGGGLASGLSRVRRFWQPGSDETVQRQNIEMAVPRVEPRLVVEIPETNHTAVSQGEATSKAATSRTLKLENPPSSGGPVSFLIDGRCCTLLVGESHSFPAETPHAIQFHRGGDFGVDEVRLTGGHFQFRVTEEGWQLIPTN
jgi:hypothetical protein